MTTVTKPVRRVIEGVERGRDVILTIYPGGALGFRVKRCRKEWYLSVASAYRQAIIRQAELDRAEKRKARGGKVLVRRGAL
jgi:hypothetical protein